MSGGARRRGAVPGQFNGGVLPTPGIGDRSRDNEGPYFPEREFSSGRFCSGGAARYSDPRCYGRPRFHDGYGGPGY